jgi:MFS family permease
VASIARPTRSRVSTEYRRTLLAAIADVAHPSWRASAVGVYRLWRDLGYAIGALLAGITADAFGIDAAIWLVACMTFASGVIVAVRMRETQQGRSSTVAAPSHVEKPGVARSPCLLAHQLDDSAELDCKAAID